MNNLPLSYYTGSVHLKHLSFYIIYIKFTHQMGAFQLSSSPWVEGGPASCVGPCTASSSTEGQSSSAEVEVEPCCWADTGLRPVWVQALAAVLSLVKDPVAAGAEGTAGFAMPGSAAAAATVAAASKAAPKQKRMRLRKTPHSTFLRGKIKKNIYKNILLFGKYCSDSCFQKQQRNSNQL